MEHIWTWEKVISHHQSVHSSKTFVVVLDLLFLGVVSTNGHLWKQQRRFALYTLKYFGVGKKSLQSAVLDEFAHLSQDITDYNGIALKGMWQ